MSVHAGLLINTLLTHPVCPSALACVYFGAVFVMCATGACVVLELQSAALHVVAFLHPCPPTGWLSMCVSVNLRATVFIITLSPTEEVYGEDDFFFFTQICSSGFSSSPHTTPKSEFITDLCLVLRPTPF